MSLPRGTFGNAVKKARNEKNLTQEKLAELLNISFSHMQQLESGRKNPSIDLLYKMVGILHISLDSLFNDSDDNIHELRNKINVCLNCLNERELSIIYATIQAMLKFDS